jgi:hypothetical protein
MVTALTHFWVAPAFAVEAAEIWAAAGFEESPGNTDPAAAGAAKIRATRSAVGARASAEHFWGYLDSTSDDNGLHREGSARCFISDDPPTDLKDTATEFDNAGGAGSGTLSDSAVNSTPDPEDDIGHGRCWLDSDDDYRLYTYVGDTGWVPVVGERVRAGAPNILFNGDFDYDGCVTPNPITTPPTGWTDLDPGNTEFDYENAADQSQGSGCVLIAEDTSNGDGVSQLLSNLKALTTYRVVAQVKEGGDDGCTIKTTDAATNAEATSASTDWIQLDTFFITDDSLDDVLLKLESANSGDICYWDHVAVYRQEAVEVPESGIVAVFDTYLTSEGAAVSASGVGFAAVPELSIVFVPPTPGWIISLQANISLGCSSNSCDNRAAGEGVVCHLAVGGSEIAGTQRAWVTPVATGLDTGSDPFTTINLDYVIANPTAGTSLTYTVKCVEEDNGIGNRDAVYNPSTRDNTLETYSTLTMIAYPPH